MTPTEIRAAIAASPELTAMAGNTQVIADALSVGRTRPRKTEIGTGTILAAFQGLGGQFIDTLVTIGQTNRDIHWLVTGTLLRGVLDMGDPATRFGVQGLMAQSPLAAFVPGMQALLAMGVEPAPITHTQVGHALTGGN